jgi:hypothetical protein
LARIRPGRAFITDVSSRSRDPAIMSGLARIARRMSNSAGASAERGSAAGMTAGSAIIANARATSRRGNA